MYKTGRERFNLFFRPPPYSIHPFNNKQTIYFKLILIKTHTHTHRVIQSIQRNDNFQRLLIETTSSLKGWLFFSPPFFRFFFKHPIWFQTETNEILGVMKSSTSFFFLFWWLSLIFPGIIFFLRLLSDKRETLHLSYSS